VSSAAAGAASARAIRAGLMWAMLGVLLFSFSLPLTKVAIGGFNPFLTAMGRAVIAGTLAMIVLLVRRVPIPPRQYLRPLLFTMLGAIFGWAILLALALQRTTSAHAAVIAAFMPLTTAAIAVRRAHEHVNRQFWVAALTGTAALVIFALSRGGASGADPVADLLVVGAVLASSWCYVEGAVVTRDFPGWQVISWVVVLALPVTVPASIVLWATTSGDYETTTAQWISLFLLGLSSMYLAFFAWYRGLATAGIAHASQTQQLQPLLTLVWSALLLGEAVTVGTVAAALVVIASVTWALRSRAPLAAAPEE
jgi:drug/metabolite transporter (DMT)-like permease